jgi:hypothetical protein
MNEWVWSIGGMILTRETEVLGETTVSMPCDKLIKRRGLSGQIAVYFGFIRTVSEENTEWKFVSSCTKQNLNYSGFPRPFPYLLEIFCILSESCGVKQKRIHVIHVFRFVFCLQLFCFVSIPSQYGEGRKKPLPDWTPLSQCDRSVKQTRRRNLS